MDIIPGHVIRGGEMDHRERVLIRASGDIEFFAKKFLAKIVDKRTPRFHKIVYRDLQDKTIKRLGIIAPRGHAKSTVCSVVFPTHETCFTERGMDKLILLIAEAQAQSIPFLGTIMWNLEYNPLIRYYFGNMVGKKWTEDEIITSHGVKIQAKGTGQRIRGSITGRETIQRPNIIVLDDFESESNSLTPESVQKNKQWIAGAVEPSLADDGRLIAVGTIISLAAYLVDIQEDPAFKTHFFQSMMSEDLSTTGTHPIWPERFTRKRLMDEKRSYSIRELEHVWWREYMNVPIDLDNQDFRKEWIQYFNHEFVLLEGIQPCLVKDGNKIPLDMTLGLDPAISLESYADYTVITAYGRASTGGRYVVDQDRFRSNDAEQHVQKLVAMAKKYNPQTVNIETVQFQQVLATRTYQVMEEEGMAFGIEESKPRTAKDTRIRSLQPLFRERKIHIRPWMTELEQELLTFPRGKHDDTLDSLWLAEQVSTDCSMEPFSGDAPVPHDGLRDLLREGQSWLVV